MGFLFWDVLLVLLVNKPNIVLNILSKMIFYDLGHYLDQKRLKQGLYRHPWDDISYVMPEVSQMGSN